MAYDKVISVLKDASDEELRDIVSQINSWDGTFQDTEIDVHRMDEIICWFACDEDSVQRLIKLVADGKPDMSCEWFWFDECGLHSTDEVDYSYYLDEIADWLCDNAGCTGFPDYISDDIAQAVADELSMDVEDL